MKVVNIAAAAIFLYTLLFLPQGVLADVGVGADKNKQDHTKIKGENTKPEKATHEKAKPEKATPEKAKPEKATPEKANPEKATPEKANPEKGATGKPGKVERVAKYVIEKSVNAGKAAVADKAKIVEGVGKVMSGNAKSVDKETMKSAATMVKDHMEGRSAIDINLGKDSSGRDYVLRGTLEKDGSVGVSFGVSY
jgi:hypothetical protein